jgi:Domain of unknown function (DUF4192)
MPDETENQHSPTPRGRRRADQPELRVDAGAPEALLAAVPHLLGFYPSQSLVVLGLGGKHNRVQLTFRYDLPDPPDAAQAADIADHATSIFGRHGFRLAVLIGYGSAAEVVPVLVTVMKWLLSNGVGLREVLRAEGGRYWSLLCEDPRCCPDEGSPYDPGSHPVAAALTEAGLAALPDRAALARSLRPPAGSAESIRQATGLAEQRLCDLGTAHWAAGGQDPRQVTATVGKAAVQEAIRCYRAGQSITSADELAWLAVLLADLRVRDDAWARMDPAHALAHIRLWTDVLRGAATEYVPAPASLLGFTAWQSGNGGLGGVAIDRALAARPGYSMALLLERALQAGLPPSAARLPMTPDEVAASYAAKDGGPRRSGRGRARQPKPTGGGDGAAGTRQRDSARSRPSGSRSAGPGSAGPGSGAATSGASSRPSG